MFPWKSEIIRTPEKLIGSCLDIVVLGFGDIAVSLISNGSQPVVISKMIISKPGVIVRPVDQTEFTCFRPKVFRPLDDLRKFVDGLTQRLDFYQKPPFAGVVVDRAFAEFEGPVVVRDGLFSKPQSFSFGKLRVYACVSQVAEPISTTNLDMAVLSGEPNSLVVIMLDGFELFKSEVVVSHCLSKI
jgi:hypothetical protein